MTKSMPKPKTPARASRGGRPSAEEAARIEDRILDAARSLFFKEGYGAFSIETLAREARISKRTFYTRFKGKPDLFRKVVHKLIADLHTPQAANVMTTGSFEIIMHNLADMMLRAGLSKNILSLNRLLLAEAERFPELARAMDEEGTRARAIAGIGALLEKEAKAKGIKLEDPAFAAEQFIVMIISAPQRRALGLGKPFTERELKDWAPRAVKLFLSGFYAKK
jgi:AcrR family transcriptional regulator